MIKKICSVVFLVVMFITSFSFTSFATLEDKFTGDYPDGFYIDEQPTYIQNIVDSDVGLMVIIKLESSFYVYVGEYIYFAPIYGYSNYYTILGIGNSIGGVMNGENNYSVSDELVVCYFAQFDYDNNVLADWTLQSNYQPVSDFFSSSSASDDNYMYYRSAILTSTANYEVLLYGTSYYIQTGVSNSSTSTFFTFFGYYSSSDFSGYWSTNYTSPYYNDNSNSYSPYFSVSSIVSNLSSDYYYNSVFNASNFFDTGSTIYAFSTYPTYESEYQGGVLSGISGIFEAVTSLPSIISGFFDNLINYILYFQPTEPDYVNPFSNMLDGVNDFFDSQTSSIDSFIESMDTSFDSIKSYISSSSDLVNSFLTGIPILSAFLIFSVVFVVIRKVVGR